MQKPFFSIIVVSLNPGIELKNTVDSILAQTYKNMEIIVKDAGSSDSVFVELKEQGYFESNPSIHLIEKKDSSIYDGMNQAVQKAEGEYLFFLNCGDYFYHNNVLEEIYCKIADRKEKDKEATGGIFYGNMYNRRMNSFISSSPQITEFTLYRNVPCHQVCFYHRSLFDERGYNNRYVVRADYEHFLYCVYKLGVKPVYMDLVISSYEGGGFSETKENLLISSKEHKEITLQYMGKKACRKYRAILLLTLAPLRRVLAENPLFSKGYQKMKDLLYKRYF